MSKLEIGICVVSYLVAVVVYFLRKRKWSMQQEFIKYKGKHAFRINDVIPIVMIIFIILMFQIQSFSWVGFLCLIPIIAIFIICVINYNGVGENGILHFSDQYLYEDIEVYYIGEINGKQVLDVKGRTSHLKNGAKKSLDMDVAELWIEPEDVSAISKLMEEHIPQERHSEYPIYKRVQK